MCTTIDNRRRVTPPLSPRLLASISYGLVQKATLAIDQDSIKRCTTDIAQAFDMEKFDALAKQCHTDLYQILTDGSFWYWGLSDALPARYMNKYAEPGKHELPDVGELFPFGLGNLGVLDESSIPEGVQLQNSSAYFRGGAPYILSTKNGGLSIGLTGEKLSIEHRRRYGEAIVSILCAAVSS